MTGVRASAAVLSVIAGAASGAMGQAQFVPLGDLAGGSVFSKATGVSDDGRFVAGASVGTAEGFTPLRWDGTEAVPLMLPPSYMLGAEVNDISGDGMWVVGMGPSGPEFEGLRWQPDGTPVVTGTFAPGWSSANSVSRDGSVITGFDGLDFFGGGSQMYRWTPGGGEQPLGDLEGGIVFSNGTCVSNDGAVIGGYGNDDLGDRPVTWAAGGFNILGTVAGGTGLGRVLGLSHDGQVALGEAQVSDGDGGQAFLPVRWQVGGGTGEVLGAAPAGYGVGHAIASNGDGSVVIGIWRETEFSDELGSVAFIWDQQHGTRLLADALLSDYGLDLAGWTLNIISDMSPDGRFMVGYGLNPEGNFEAFKIVVPGPGVVVCGVVALAAVGGRRRRGRSGLFQPGNPPHTHDGSAGRRAPPSRKTQNCDLPGVSLAAAPQRSTPGYSR